MAYFLGKKEGVSPTTLAALGFSTTPGYGQGIKPLVSSLLGGGSAKTAGAVTPLPGVVSNQQGMAQPASMGDPCKPNCRKTYQECLALAEDDAQREACKGPRDTCLAACDAAAPVPPPTPPTPGPDCVPNCWSEYNICINSAQTPEQKAACLATKTACLTACNPVGQCDTGFHWDEATQTCVADGCPAGQHWDPALNQCVTCETGWHWDATLSKCVQDLPPNTCNPGWHWDTALGKCVKDVVPGTCPGTPGEPHNGCGACGKKYMLPAGQTTCIAGYVPVHKPNGTQCECSNWCQDIGWGADCKTRQTCEECKTKCNAKTGQAKINCLKACEDGVCAEEEDEMGEYEYPQEIQDLMARLLGRANTFLSMKPGYSETAMNKMFGQGYDKTRQAGAATDEALKQTLADQGLLGTSTGMKATQENAWATEAGVADLERNVFMANEAQKRNDLVSFTESANKLFNAGLNYEQIKEAINAGRRGEGQASLALLLQYLMGLLNSYNAA